jgi:hypothetical protein
MLVLRRIFLLLLVLSLTVTGIPFFCPQDVNRDRKIDLQDAISLVRSVVGSADEPGPFRNRISGAVTALHTVAELAMSITGEDSPSSSILSASLGVYLPCDKPVISTFPTGERVDFFTSSFSSITPAPIPHPPRV